MTTGHKYHKDKFFTKLSHAITSGVVGEEYEVFGERDLRVVSTFTSSGTLTLQGRIKGSDTWTNIGTLASGGDSDTFDISTYDIIRFNFTVAAGSTGEIVASGFFNGSSSGGGGASNSFTIIQPDAGTSPTADSATDTLTFTSSDASIIITGDASTDTIDLTASGGGGGGSGDVTGPSSSVDNAIVRFNGTTGKIIQSYTTGAPTINDSGVPSFEHPSWANSERIGATSTITGIRGTTMGYSATAAATGTSMGYGAKARQSSSVAMGYLADANGTSGLALGSSTVASGASSTAIGTGSDATATNAFALGPNAQATAIYGVSIGNGANAAHRSSFCVGRSATSTAEDQIVFGGQFEVINQVWYGCNANGHNSGNRPSSFQHRHPPVTGTDVFQVDTEYYAGAGTGTGAGGDIAFFTAPPSTTGSTANSFVEVLKLTDDGEMVFKTLDAVTADATLNNNSTTFYLDETGNNLVIKSKYSTGTVKTATIALT